MDQNMCESMQKFISIQDLVDLVLIKLDWQALINLRLASKEFMGLIGDNYKYAYLLNMQDTGVLIEISTKIMNL